MEEVNNYKSSMILLQFLPKRNFNNVFSGRNTASNKLRNTSALQNNKISECG
jgi:hypothetical protein